MTCFSIYLFHDQPQEIWDPIMPTITVCTPYWCYFWATWAAQYQFKLPSRIQPYGGVRMFLENDAILTFAHLLSLFIMYDAINLSRDYIVIYSHRFYNGRHPWYGSWGWSTVGKVPKVGEFANLVTPFGVRNAPTLHDGKSLPLQYILAIPLAYQLNSGSLMLFLRELHE